MARGLSLRRRVQRRVDESTAAFVLRERHRAVLCERCFGGDEAGALRSCTGNDAVPGALVHREDPDAGMHFGPSG